MHVQVVVNAQFEDQMPERICAGDSVKRAGLFMNVLCRGECVYMRVYMCVYACIWITMIVIRDPGA